MVKGDMGTDRKTATIHDVAREASVSTASVSRTLGNPDVVSPKTRARVHDAIRKTGYRVNHAARNLRTRKTSAIIVLVPNLGNPFFSAILSGVERTLARNGYNVLICDTQSGIESATKLVDYFRAGQTDGILVLDGAIPPEDLRELRASEFADRAVFVCEWRPTQTFSRSAVTIRRAQSWPWITLLHLVTGALATYRVRSGTC